MYTLVWQLHNNTCCTA